MEEKLPQSSTTKCFNKVKPPLVCIITYKLASNIHTPPPKKREENTFAYAVFFKILHLPVAVKFFSSMNNFFIYFRKLFFLL